ncbi:hypothetical protein H6P81_009438 [Aristolochia fimbriata]|uniref:Uncharacterized protein n=1 Tax=Aristolochia fimbriata TaxID=158543 RepID=A0AAV7EL22_ARIFI|nr:hypothetical protein H6P81_009438 [Aristolochia fimbriata]
MHAMRDLIIPGFLAFFPCCSPPLSSTSEDPNHRAFCVRSSVKELDPAFECYGSSHGWVIVRFMAPMKKQGWPLSRIYCTDESRFWATSLAARGLSSSEEMPFLNWPLLASGHDQYWSQWTSLLLTQPEHWRGQGQAFRPAELLYAWRR